MAEQYEAATTNAVTAAGRYKHHELKRLPFLNRARTAAAHTIPGLMPPEGHDGSTPLPQPFSSAGAEGVNNLSAKLLMVLFPAGDTFFRLPLDEFTLEKLKATAEAQGADPAEMRTAYENALSKIERTVVTYREQMGARTVDHETLQHLIVAGNGLQEIRKDGSKKFYPLTDYVVCRDLDDNILELITKQSMSVLSLPQRIREHLKEVPEKPDLPNEKNVDIYTWVKRTERGWTVEQEVAGSTVPGTTGTYPKDALPWIALRWRRVSGEAYGRGHVEEFGGSHTSVESLERSIVQFAAQAAKVVWLVSESGQTDKKKLANAPNGAIMGGEAKDVTVLMLEKFADFQVAKSVKDAAENRLQRAYLNASSIQRDAERVTAEEIRAMVSELEIGLGGVYSILALEWQRPEAAAYLNQLAKARKIPQLPKKFIRPQIVTGVAGLSRQSEAAKLDELLAGLAQLFGPEVVSEWVNVGQYISRKGDARGLDTSGIVRTQGQVDQARSEAQRNEAMQKLGPQAMQLAGDAAMAAREQQTNQ